MKLVLIHGPPAAGKLTVARQLQRHHGFKLLHNHLAVDLCLAIYDEFGQGDFHEFADTLRRTVIAKAQSLGVERMVMTFMLCGEKHHKTVAEYLAFFNTLDIELFPVQLFPRRDVLLARAVAEDRGKSNKLSCPDQLLSLLSDTAFAPIAHEKLLVVDNSAVSPGVVADRIMSHMNESGTRRQ